MYVRLRVRSSDIMGTVAPSLPPSQFRFRHWHSPHGNLRLVAQTLRVRRLLDEKNQTLLYIAYSTRLSSSPEEGISSGRYRHVVELLVLCFAFKKLYTMFSSFGRQCKCQHLCVMRLLGGDISAYWCARSI